MLWLLQVCMMMYVFILPAAASTPTASTPAASATGALAPHPSSISVTEEAAGKSALDDVGKKKKEEEAKMTAAEEEAAKKKKEKIARVIVLKWMGTDTNHNDETLQRNVKSRIARPDAGFYPEVDLYQSGRKVKDKTVVPAMQPAVVPNQNIDRVVSATNEVAAIPWNGMAPDQWGLKAQELRELVELLWFVDRVELREPLFLLYTQIGKSAENQNNPIPPFYEELGRLSVNYYFYLAAQLAYQDPALMSKLTDAELNAQVGAILQQIQQGAYPSLKLDFELDGENFDLEQFGTEYEVLLNGIPIEVDDQGRYDVFVGRNDVYMKRKDSGHGLSDRLEVVKLDEKTYFVRENARKKMGKDFIEQLFLHPNECAPELDGDILNYLAIYAKLHEKAEIYIAVPEEGNPNKTYIWRYDRASATLQQVAGGNDGFPVRFAVLAGAGLMYNALTIEYESPESITPSDDIDSYYPSPSDLLGYNLKTAYIPVNLELRGHYNRLMVTTGYEFGFNTGGDGSDGAESRWVERYHLPRAEDAVVVYDKNPDEVKIVDADGENVDADDDGKTDTYVTASGQELYREVRVNINHYLGVGIVLGRDAGIGFGPRFLLRVGTTNVPHALQTTGHFGWTFDAPFVGNLSDRVRPFVDADLRIGAAWAFKDSLSYDKSKTVTVGPVYGLVAGIGTTF